MQIYIEYVIIDNFVFDWLILYFVLKLLHFPPSRRLIFLSSLCGTFYALASPFFESYFILSLILKLAVPLIMLLVVMSKRLSFSGVIRGYIILITVSAVFYGIIMLFNGIFFDCGFLYSSVGFYCDIPIGLIAIGGIFAVCLIRYVISFINRKKPIFPFIREVTLSYHGTSVKTNGLIDTGNSVVNGCGDPVCFISDKLATCLLGLDYLKLFGYLNNEYALSNGISFVGKNVGRGKVTFRGIDDVKQTIPSFFVNSIDILNSDGKHHICENVCFAVSQSCFDGLEYEIILNPSVLEKGDL